MKYSKRLADRIIEMIEQDLFGITEICRIIGIAPKTFYQWKKTKPEFAEMIDDAIAFREERMVSSAKAALKKLIEGYVVKEEKVTYIPHRHHQGQEVEKSRVVRTKNYPPNLRAIQYILDKQDRKKQEAEVKEQQPWIIRVVDEETKTQLEILKDKGKEGIVSVPVEIKEAIAKESPQEKEPAPTPVESPKPQERGKPTPKPAPQPYVNTFFPPGYTHRAEGY